MHWPDPKPNTVYAQAGGRLVDFIAEWPKEMGFCMILHMVTLGHIKAISTRPTRPWCTKQECNPSSFRLQLVLQDVARTLDGTKQ